MQAGKHTHISIVCNRYTYNCTIIRWNHAMTTNTQNHFTALKNKIRFPALFMNRLYGSHTHTFSTNNTIQYNKWIFMMKRNQILFPIKWALSAQFIQLFDGYYDRHSLNWILQNASIVLNKINSSIFFSLNALNDLYSN